MLFLTLGNGCVTLISSGIDGKYKLVFIILAVLLILGGGIYWYRSYLEGKMKEFPDHSPFIRRSMVSQSTTKANNIK